MKKKELKQRLKVSSVRVNDLTNDNRRLERENVQFRANANFYASAILSDDEARDLLRRHRELEGKVGQLVISLRQLSTSSGSSVRRDVYAECLALAESCLGVELTVTDATPSPDDVQRFLDSLPQR